MRVARSTLAFIAGVGLLVFASVALATSGTFAGKTSQGMAIKITVKNNAVKHGSTIGWRASCKAANGQKQASLIYATTFSGKLKHGKFSAHGTYTSDPTQGPGFFKNTVTIAITIQKRKATGTFSLTAKGYSSLVSPPKPDGTTCKTGKVTFTVRS